MSYSFKLFFCTLKYSNMGITKIFLQYFILYYMLQILRLDKRILYLQIKMKH